MLSDDSLQFLAGHVGWKPAMQAAAEIAEIVGAGLAMAEILDFEADGGVVDKIEMRAAVDRYHRATAAFFILPPSAPSAAPKP